MKTLIFKEWFKIFFSSAMLLFLLISVANLITGFLRGNVSVIDVIMNHILETPGAMNKILPVSCLVASLFSINKLKNRNELTAIFASGFSRKEYLFTIFQASVLVALFQFGMSGFIDPYAKKHRSTLISNPESKFKNLKSKGLRAKTVGSGKLWYRSNDYFFSFSTYDKHKKKLYNIALFFIDAESRLYRTISADSMIFTNNNIWTVSKGIESYGLSKNDFPIIKTLYNQAISIREKPKDFLQIEADITTLNVMDLMLYVRQLQQSGINVNEYLVLLYDKFSSALICIIFSLLAAISIFDPNRRNKTFGKNIVFIFIFTLSYWLIYSYSLELGKSSRILPLISTFSVPAFFLLFLSYYFIKNRDLK
ncbi:MAG: YjgP/YjgQ family permease [Bacteriovoracaceae bacterium]|nr:YjgP/YjgQ family permease [Bacteriovoracaceae bacterium]